MIEFLNTAYDIVENLKKGILVTYHKSNGRVYKLESYIDGLFYVEINYSSEDVDLELLVNKSDWSYETKILGCPE